tara:strand:- start:1327 stop:2097 length:771 start_codon:yes stop_codon:yes gene_type:complete
MRARNIKPNFFNNDDLAECTPLARLLFAGLWCYCDREGRAEYKPKRIKKEILGYDDCDIFELLTELENKNFIVRYDFDGMMYFYIPNFIKHQKPHHQEKESALPCPAEAKNEPLRTKVRTTSHQGACDNALIADRGLLIADRGKRKEEEPSKFAFEGDVIKLTHKDFEKWSSSFSAIYDLKAELQALEDWFSKPENESNRKSWFHMVSGILKKEHVKQQKILDETKVHYTPEEKAKARAYEEKIKAGYDPNEKWDL